MLAKEVSNTTCSKSDAGDDKITNDNLVFRPAHHNHHNMLQIMRVTHLEATIQSSLLKTAKSAPVIVVFGRVGVLVSRIIRPNLDTLVANSRVLPPKQNKQILSPPI